MTLMKNTLWDTMAQQLYCRLGQSVGMEVWHQVEVALRSNAKVSVGICAGLVETPTK